MRRGDLQAGVEYFAGGGRRVRVVDLVPGWVMEGGQWVHRPVMTRRFHNGAWLEVQTNFDLKAEESQDGGATWFPITISPRAILSTWNDAQMATEGRPWDLTAQQERQQRLREALHARGIENVSFPSTTQVTLLMEDLDRLLEGY